MKFKVGDVVRISTPDPAFNGRVGPIEFINHHKDYHYYVRIEGFGYVSAFDTQLEKVEDQ